MAKLSKKELEDKIKNVVSDVLDKDYEKVKEESKNYVKEMMAKAEETRKAVKSGEKGQNVEKFIRALIAGKGNIEKAADFAKKKMKDEKLEKSLRITDYEDGGVLAPYEYSSELIDLLRPLTVVRQLGARVLPLSGGMIMPRQVSGSSAFYVGEEGEVNASKLQFGDLKFEEKELMTVVPVSNKLIRVAGERANQVVTDDITQNMAIKSDAAFIRGQGTEFSPKGMFYWADSDNKVSMSDDGGSITLETVDYDLTNLMYKLKAADIPMIRPGWIISPRTEIYLMRLKDSNGNYVYRDEMKDGLIWGMPYRATNQIADNLGNNGDESEVYLADFAQLIIAESSQVQFLVSNEASYKDANGNLVSAFSKDQTVVRAKAIHDFGARHDKAIAVLEGVTWGTS